MARGKRVVRRGKFSTGPNTQGNNGAAGYGKPPASSRFRAGESGNPKGRPKGRKQDLPYEALLGQLVTIREDGEERRITADRAFLLHMAKRGLAGDGAAGRSALAAIEGARATQASSSQSSVLQITTVIVGPENANLALRGLRMATKLDRFRPSARMAIEPWLVEAALARLGSKRLTLHEQEVVRSATRTPHKVKVAGVVGT